MVMPDAPTLPPFDHEASGYDEPVPVPGADPDHEASVGPGGVGDPPSDPPLPDPGRDPRPDDGPRWLGYRPRTLVILGVIVALIVVAEAQWLYSPFGSGSSTSSVSVTGTDTGDTTATDPSDPNATDSTDSTEAPGSSTPAKAVYLTRATVTLRADATSASAAVGRVPSGTKVTVECVKVGEAVAGPHGPDPHWDRVTFKSVTGYITNTLTSPSPGVPAADRLPGC